MLQFRHRSGHRLRLWVVYRSLAALRLPVAIARVVQPSTALHRSRSVGRRAVISVAGAVTLFAGFGLALAPASSAASSTFAVTELPVGSITESIATDPATNTVYAATSTAGIAVINGATNTVTSQINVPPSSGALAVDTASDTVYAIADAASGTAAGTAYVIDGATNAVTATVSLPAGFVAQGAAVNPETNMVYVVDTEHGTVIALDGATDTVAAIIPLTDPVLAPTPSLRGIAVDTATNMIYVADAEESAISGANSGEVEAIDGATNSVTGWIALAAGVVPVGIAVDPASGLAYIADDHLGTGAGAVDVVDTSTESVSVLASGLTQPSGLALDSSTGTLYVASPVSTVGGAGFELGTTYVIDTASGAITAEIPRGGKAVALTPASGGAAYVAPIGDILLTDDVTVITPSTESSMSPVIVSGFGDLSATIGQAFQDQVVASATPAATFSATGLPAWLTISPSGLLSGTAPVGSGGVYTVTVTAANGIAPPSTETISLTVGVAPAITSADQAVFQEGVAGSFTVTATGIPAPSFAETGALPAGVTLTTAGVLSGTPEAGTSGSYPITITASNTAGSATQAFTLIVDAPPGVYTPVSPVRVLDTRNGTGGYDEPVGPGGTISLQVGGADGVPASGVTAVVLNVTATDPTASSYVTVYPDGQAQPTASNLNFTAGETIANLVTVPDIDGKVDFYNNSGSVDLVADLEGYYTTGTGSAFVPAGPERMLDTRDGTGAPQAPVGPGGTISLQVTGADGVPSSGVTAVALNVTATDTTAASYVTVYPDGGTRPLASNLNFTAGETIPNLVVVPVGADGKVDFYNNSGSTDLVADLAGYYTTGTGSSFVAVSPARMLDTRNGTGGYTTPVGPGSTISLQITGVDGIPATGVTAVVLNVTATDPTASSYVTVYPDGTTRPTASNLNFTDGQTIPNLVIVPVGADGEIDFYNNTGSTDLVADLEGYYLN
jgi:DNA-binding beta-propeller fold protein YncE